ncbi:hypothetical protein GGF32_006125, partial [Allomyces javanicus]
MITPFSWFCRNAPFRHAALGPEAFVPVPEHRIRYYKAFGKEEMEAISCFPIPPLCEHLTYGSIIDTKKPLPPTPPTVHTLALEHLPLLMVFHLGRCTTEGVDQIVVGLPRTGMRELVLLHMRCDEERAALQRIAMVMPESVDTLKVIVSAEEIGESLLEEAEAADAAAAEGLPLA